VTPIAFQDNWLSVDAFIGCPLSCAYCYRHVDGLFEYVNLERICSDEYLVDHVRSLDLTSVNGRVAIAGRFYDPLLRGAIKSTEYLLDHISSLPNVRTLVVVSHLPVTVGFVKRLQRVCASSVLFLSHSGLAGRIEQSGPHTLERSAAAVRKAGAEGRAALYWRPVIEGINTSGSVLDTVSTFASRLGCVVIKGLYLTAAIEDELVSRGIPRSRLSAIAHADNDLAPQQEALLVKELKRRGCTAKVFFKTREALRCLEAAH
jgi:hypothetical protein